MTSPKNTSTASKTEKHEFGAEVGRLLDLVVHSLYSEREIFLRELLANAADASDKRRFEALTDAALSLPDEAPISVRVDLPEKKIEISDQGMGMSRDELVANLGTIARSGTRAFGEKLKEASVSERPSLIGQFGVGFYSAFMVADRVEVISRKAGAAEAWKWESDGKGAYELSRAERAVPGTDIILHVKENASEFLSPARLKEIVQKWTRHLSWPIDLEEPEEDGKPKKIRINEGSALWTRQKSKISQEEYEGFYRQLTHNFDKPADILHWRAEGVVEFSSLLFVPSARPFDFFSKQERESRVKLFVRRMFITEEAELLPPWLRFVQGVVDTEDLPLNVSREMLQSTPVLSRIRKAVTSRMVSQLEALAKSAPGGTAGSGNRDGEEKKEAGEKPVWFGIWENFGPVLKEGIWEDAEYRQTLAKIALFRSTHGEGWVTLADYVSRMKPEQEAIYYLVGESEAAVQNSAQLEGFRARGVEALLLSDPVDSFWPERLHAFAGKPLKSVLESGEDLEKFGLKESEGRLESRNLDRLLAVLKKALGEEVKDVRATDRLTDSPLLLSQEGGPDLAMQRLLRRSGQPIPPVPPVMELNPRHPLLHALADRADRGEEEDLKEYGRVLLDLGRLQEGEPLRDPSGFARVLAGLLAGSAGKDDAPAKKSKKKAD